MARGAGGTGPITLDDFGALIGADPPEDLDPVAFDAFIRKWENSATQEGVVLVIAKFPSVVDAEGFYLSVDEAIAPPDFTRFSTGLPLSFGFKFDREVQATAVATIEGRFAFVVIHAAAPDAATAPMGDIVIDMSRQQRNAALTAEELDLRQRTPAPAVPDDVGAAAASGLLAAARVFAGAAVVTVVGVLAWVLARRGRRT